MTTATVRSINSTIDRMVAVSVTQREPQERQSPARRRILPGVLTAILEWIRDPAGVGAELGTWTLDDEEVRADLEHGRD